MEALAESGDLAAAECIAEIFTFSEPHKNPAKGYKWYHVSLARNGYTTDFKDLNNSPPHYCGEIGDFRNEAQVSGLIVELGFDRIREIDNEAKKWLARHRQ